MSASINDEHFRNTLYSWPEAGMILFYENFYHKLLRIADMHTRDRKSSEDVLQEVFADVWKRHKEIGQMRDEPIERYLIKAVQYSSITHYKKRVRTAECETQYYYANSESLADTPAESDSSSTNDQRLMKLIAGTFPDREKECLLLRMEGLPVKEIARQLGITRKAVERNLTRARKRFRRFGSRFY